MHMDVAEAEVRITMFAIYYSCSVVVSVLFTITAIWKGADCNRCYTYSSRSIASNECDISKKYMNVFTPYIELPTAGHLGHASTFYPDKFLCVSTYLRIYSMLVHTHLRVQSPV